MKREITFVGKDAEQYTLTIEKNNLNNNVMYWFSHSPTMYHKGVKEVLKSIKENCTIVKDEQIN